MDNAELERLQTEEYSDILRRFETELAHVLQVQKLALRLFDDTLSEHGLGREARKELEVASALHDIGWSKSPQGEKHHKLSAQMILEYPWTGFREDQVRRIAQVARYHRKSIPDPDRHPEFAALSLEDQNWVTKAAALLRLADGLDRSHCQRVTDVNVQITPAAWVIKVFSSTPTAREIVGAQRKMNLAVKVFGKAILWAEGKDSGSASVKEDHSGHCIEP